MNSDSTTATPDDISSHTRLTCQKHLFSLEPGAKYLNCAAYSPFMVASKEAGVRAMEIKSNPQHISSQHHFTESAILRSKYAELINEGDADRIAIFPSVSYGMAIVANNLHRLPGVSTKRSLLILESEFPNDTYAFERVAKDLNLSIDVVKMCDDISQLGDKWNESLLEQIQEGTAAVIVPHVHWIYGVVFDLVQIGRKCREVGALLIVDGTQSVGVMPFDVQLIQPDAVIVSAYKWVFGPYSSGFGYFGPFFDDGVPIEESWMNREGSDNFQGLCNLQPKYRPKAQRYNMGEFSQFIQCAMALAAVENLLSWGVPAVQEYIVEISRQPLLELADLGCRMVQGQYRAPHVFGLLLPPQIDGEVKSAFVAKLRENQVYVSLRGDAIRVAVNIFNEKEDLFALVNILKLFV